MDDRTESGMKNEEREKSDEGRMGREGRKRDYLRGGDISSSGGDKAHTRSAVNQRPFLTRHSRL